MPIPPHFNPQRSLKAHLARLGEPVLFKVGNDNGVAPGRACAKGHGESDGASTGDEDGLAEVWRRAEDSVVRDRQGLD